MAIVALGLLLRVGASLAVPADSVDMHEFGTIGHNLVAGYGYSYHTVTPTGAIDTDGERGDAAALTGVRLPSAFVPPGYTMIVAAVIAVAPDYDVAVRLLQLVNLLAAAGLIVALCRLGALVSGPEHGREVGVLAALLAALYPPLIYATTQVSSANVYLPLGTALLVALAWAGSTRRVAPAAVVGVTLGVLCLFRSEAVVLVPLAALWMVLARRRWRAGRISVATAVLVATAIVLPVAWMARTSVMFERPVLTVATTGGFNLWIGNHEGATGSQKQYVTLAGTATRVAAVAASPGYEAAVDAVYLHESLRDMAADPVGTVLLDGKKVAMLVTVDVYDSRTANPIYLGSWLLLLVLSTAGLITARLRGPIGWLLYGQLIFSVVFPVVFFVLARYRLGIETTLIPFAALWIGRRLGQMDSQTDVVS